MQHQSWNRKKRPRLAIANRSGKTIPTPLDLARLYTGGPPDSSGSLLTSEGVCRGVAFVSLNKSSSRFLTVALLRRPLLCFVAVQRCQNLEEKRCSCPGRSATLEGVVCDTVCACTLSLFSVVCPFLRRWCDSLLRFGHWLSCCLVVFACSLDAMPARASSRCGCNGDLH